MARGSAGAPLFAVLLLQKLHAPLTANNLSKLYTWQEAEGNPGVSYNNWFNTTLYPGFGGTPGLVGVTDFPTVADGAAATAVVIQEPAYTSILSNLRSDGSWSQFSSAVWASPWAKSHYIGSGGQRDWSSTPVTSYGGPAAPGGSAGTAGTSATQNAPPGPTGCNSANCKVGFGGVLGQGKTCFVNECQLQAIKGGLTLIAGGFLGLVGLTIILLDVAKGPLSSAAAGALEGGPAGAAAALVTQHAGNAVGKVGKAHYARQDRQASDKAKADTANSAAVKAKSKRTLTPVEDNGETLAQRRARREKEGFGPSSERQAS